MADIFRTLIVPFANVELARSIAASFGPGGEGMWTTPLSVDGLEPRTHYISSGYIPEQFAYLVPKQVWEYDEEGNLVQTSSEPGDPVAVYQICSQEQFEPNPNDPDNPISIGPRVSCTQAQINALFQAADVTEQEPFAAMARLGLQIISPQDTP